LLPGRIVKRKLAAPHSLIAFDYMNVEAFDPGQATPQVQELKDKVRLWGEPMKKCMQGLPNDVFHILVCGRCETR
jgi:hypothetical protein